MSLVRNGELVTDDPYTDASSLEAVPETGAVIVSLEQWQRERETLLARKAPLGIRLRSEQSPAAIADDLAHFAVVALEFPKFRDCSDSQRLFFIHDRGRHTKFYIREKCISSLALRH